MAGISLRDYQIDAVKRMRKGCILCGGVGSGKSRTALAYYYMCNGGEIDTDEYVPMDDPPKDLYIITTARKRDTLEWEGELTPFLLSIHDDINLYSNKVVVDSWNNIKKYSQIKDAFFIFDEQRVVGSGGRVFICIIFILAIRECCWLWGMGKSILKDSKIQSLDIIICDTWGYMARLYSGIYS